MPTKSMFGHTVSVLPPTTTAQTVTTNQKATKILPLAPIPWEEALVEKLRRSCSGADGG
jgi:hypothetical protein